MSKQGSLQKKSVSAVVCSLNAAPTIEACLKSLRENGVSEIILVDADSDDGTPELAAPFADKILRDPRKGLGFARNIGIAAAKGRYVLNCGVDNIMLPGSLDGMVNCLEQGGYAGVSALTVIRDPGYIGWAMNIYRRLRFSPGERSVIGTPTLFAASLLQANPFDVKRSHSDDADLCERWQKQFGARFAIAPAEVLEVGEAELGRVVMRWHRYGISDHEIYSGHPEWSRMRKLKSLAYPLRVELFEPFWRCKGIKRFGLLPFLTLITFLRYRGWLMTAWKKHA